MKIAGVMDKLADKGKNDGKRAIRDLGRRDR